MHNAPERRERILSILTGRGQVTYRELLGILQEEYSLSKSTLQRDIISLSSGNAITIKRGCKGGINLVQRKKSRIKLEWSKEIILLLQELCMTVDDPEKVLLLQQVMEPDIYFGNMHDEMNMKQRNLMANMPPPLLMTLDEFRTYLGIGRTKAMELIHEEGCPYAVKVGKRLYVNRRKFEAWLDERTGST